MTADGLATPGTSALAAILTVFSRIIPPAREGSTWLNIFDIKLVESIFIKFHKTGHPSIRGLEGR